MMQHRRQEAAGILRLALALANEHDLPATAVRAQYNLAAVDLEGDRLAEALETVNAGLALARERGDRAWERLLLQQSIAPLVVLGRWDQAEPIAAGLVAGSLTSSPSTPAPSLPRSQWRGATTRRSSFAARLPSGSGIQRMSTYAPQLRSFSPATSSGTVLRTRRYNLAQPILDAPATAGEAIAEAYALSVEAALRLADDAAIEDLIAFVAALPPVRATPLLRAGRARLEAELAHRRGDADAAQAHADDAIALLRSLGARPLLAQVLSERAHRREDPEALTEARAIYTDLGATRWLARLDDPSGVPA